MNFGISIHAPRVGCDTPMYFRTEWNRNFNPRTPCGVRRLWMRRVRRACKFQSTHPVWGATGVC